MDAIRVSKVEDVGWMKGGVISKGTIHLTAHHLIFRFDDAAQREVWVPYPLISLVTRLPQTLQGRCPLTFHTRTFETFSLIFNKDSDAHDVFESVKELTVADNVNQLYAFYYNPNPPYPTSNGWSIYSPREEFGRMGIGTRTKAWRFTDINKDYSVCPTYPSRLVVPTKMGDTTLQYASKYRSKCRIPAFTYLHWANYASITRSSQPMVGLTQNRSIQDEKLIEAIFQSHWAPDSRASNAPIYGATTTNLIIDARPTTNAMANTAKGAGTENMDHYKEGKKAYLGIDHIHTMRESLGKVVEALREADSFVSSISTDFSAQFNTLAVLDRQALRRSGWLRHISIILEGTLLITKNVHINSSHVLIHCSDGWDRTAQLSSLSQLCLDPFYRTIRGFEILVEKDWLSFGHKFLDRCGHLSSEKFFVSPTDFPVSGSTDAAQAFLASVQNRFASQSHIKETSPIFHQFLESVRQIQRQFPERFEFSERFLRQLYYHLYSCQFGTFLFNSERERRVGDGSEPPCERTVSIWDFFNTPAEMEHNLNPSYNPALDDSSSRAPGADMGVLLLNPKDVRFWHELYGRTDEEMNGRLVTAQTKGIEVLGLVEGFDDDPTQFQPPSPSIPFVSTPETSTSRSPAPSFSGQPSMTTGSPRDSSPLTSGSIFKSPARKDSLSPFTPPLSGYGNLLYSSAPSAGSSRPPSPGRGLLKPPDFFAGSGVGSGMKSMWGKLSSNASAALSVVQEAYAGVAKDYVKGNDDMNQEGTSELQPHTSLEDWTDTSTVSESTRSPSYLTSTNPWATTMPRQLTISRPLDENPWSSTTRSNKNDPLSDTLPADPTVAYPQASAPRPLVSSLPRAMTGPNIEDGSGVKEELSRTTVGADPLGVGLL
ncbi:hypothetical protein AX15_006328 [Amanita polypyramis BW_CC]|nr:hypothetical protein AX15_006328 [Amanita polypyramis BW_CC]